MKKLRHGIENIENEFSRSDMLTSRDAESDPLSYNTLGNELERKDISDLLRANFKRAQEAARVIEEYTKPISELRAAETAKRIRFTLYTIEKEIAKEGV